MSLFEFGIGSSLCVLIAVRFITALFIICILVICLIFGASLLYCIVVEKNPFAEVESFFGY